MIHMRNVGRNHILVLDTKTDASKVLNIETDDMVMTFNSGTVCTDKDGNVIARVQLHNNNWVTSNELGIETKPVSFNKMEGVFDVEADFAKQWLTKKGVEA